MTSFIQIPNRYLSEPFLLDEALRDGVPRKLLYGPRFRQPFSGVRVPCTLPDTLEIRCQVASLILPAKAAFCHQTAADLCGLPLPNRPSTHGLGRTLGGRPVQVPGDPPGNDAADAQPIHVIVEPGTAVPYPRGIRGHDGLDVGDVIEVRGLRVVSPTRTFVDLAPRLGLDSLVMLGDAVVRHWATREELVGRVAGLSGRRGIVRARKAVALVREGVDSPPETRVRLMLIRAGLPEPELNVNVFDPAGGWVARPDLAYRHLKIAIEYDGDHHRTDKNQWRRDRARDNNLRDAGWIVITLTADDLYKRPDKTVDLIRRHYRTRLQELGLAA